MRGDLMETTTQLVVEQCYSCAVPFAMPEYLKSELLKDHSRSFWCPNGHPQHYLGKTKEQQAIERAERAERARANAEENARIAEASLIATKGHLTRARKRAARGVCPHPKCHRSFVDVAKHVAGQHPELLEATP